MTATAEKTVPVEQGYSAFISHASDDREIGQAICNQLEAKGFRCWIAPRDVRPGEDYPSEIIRGIEASKCLVLVLSNYANNSSFVRSEVERAYSKGKPIFPIRVEEVLPSRALELFVSTKHWVDAWQGDLSTHAARLVAEMARDPDLDLPLTGGLRRRALLTRYAWLGVGVIAAAAVAGVVAIAMRPNPQDFLVVPETDIGGFHMPPAPTFFGDLLTLDEFIDVTFSLRAGLGVEDSPDVFKGDMRAEFFQVSADAPPKLLYRSEPGQFAQFHQSTDMFNFRVDSLPMKVVSCLTYMIPETEQALATLHGFNFNLPPERLMTFPISDAAAPETVERGPDFDCSSAAANFAASHMILS